MQPEPRRHDDEDLVADGGPEAVVDLLEAVEVEEAHRQPLAAGADTTGVGVQQPVVEQRPVRKPGQRVVQRLADQAVLERLPLADVAHRDDDAADVGVGAQVVAEGLDGQPGAG